jgi:uncharacterized membrane protein YfcA
MVKYICLVAFGIIAGVVGGMGMGGGTMLIPLLTFFSGLSQKSAQAINLVSFIPMSVIALIIHVKNKRVDFKNVLYIIIPSVATSIIGGFLITSITNDVLKRCFGIFLILLAIFNIFMVFIDKNTEKKLKSNNPFYNQKI